MRVFKLILIMILFVAVVAILPNMILQFIAGWQIGTWAGDLTKGWINDAKFF